MTQDAAPRFVAFEGVTRIAAGALADVAAAVGRAQASDPAAPLLVFDGATGRVVDLDLRGTEADVRSRYAPAPPRRGRPRLGVTAREVTLLPRQWDWLAAQPGGASVTLRRLVDAARKADAGAAESRARAEAAYRFMSAMAGDLPGFDEAARALFAGDSDRLAGLIGPWPADVRDEIWGFLGAARA
jgi:hypothetical protein